MVEAVKPEDPLQVSDLFTKPVKEKLINKRAKIISKIQSKYPRSGEE